MYSLVKCEFLSLSFVNRKSVYFSPVSLYKVCCQSGKHFQHRQQGLVCHLSVEIFPKNKWLDYAHKMDRKKTTKKGFLIYDITPWTSLESCGRVNCPLHSEFTADMDFKWGASKPRVETSMFEPSVWNPQFLWADECLWPLFFLASLLLETDCIWGLKWKIGFVKIFVKQSLRFKTKCIKNMLNFWLLFYVASFDSM